MLAKVSKAVRVEAHDVLIRILWLFSVLGLAAFASVDHNLLQAFCASQRDFIGKHQRNIGCHDIFNVVVLAAHHSVVGYSGLLTGKPLGGQERILDLERKSWIEITTRDPPY